MFSARSAQSRTPNQLAQRLATLSVEERANLLDLSGSNPTRAGIDYPEELLRVLLEAQPSSLAYQPEPFGAWAARRAVCRQFAESRGARVDAEDVLLTASTSEAYTFLFKLLCDPGEAVLVPAPSYPLFEQLATLEGVQALPYRLAYDGAWHVDLDSVSRALTPRARAIIVVSPNNPSGQYLKQSELTALAGHGLPIISDEVFYEYPLGQPPAPLSIPDGLLFRLSGLSKLAGSPQLKLAWTVLSGAEPARREARERLELIADTFLSVSAPAQAALPGILELCPRITSSIGQRCRASLAWLSGALCGAPLDLLHTEGGWNAVLRLPAVQSEADFVVGLVSEAQVLVQPGWFYDFEREPYVIVSLLTEPATLREGVERLLGYVTKVAG